MTNAQYNLESFLDSVFEKYHRVDYLSSDPLEFVHKFQDPWDQEAVALISAMLAYGNVKQIRRSVNGVLARMNQLAPGHPAEFVRGLENSKAASRLFDDFVHRFNSGRDLIVLLSLLARSWRDYGSLGAHFVHHLEPSAAHFGNALDQLIADWSQWARRFRRGSFDYFLTAPRAGSCCKRWCMFLRWMGRKDALDPGLWGTGGELTRAFPEGRFLKPAQLVIPVDTHVGRIGQYLGLTRRKSLNWSMALEITENLRSFDSDDPTRYDFALSRLGILELYRELPSPGPGRFEEESG